MIPYEKFKSLENPAQYLKPDVTLQSLDEAAMKLTDQQSAENMQTGKRELFKKISDSLQFDAEILFKNGRSAK